MTDLALYITNKNYSSWSLRIWLLMRALAIPFEEVMAPMTGKAQIPGMTDISPTGKVPCLVDRDQGGLAVWESIAITEYLNELFPECGIWPARCVTVRGHGHWCRKCMAALPRCAGNVR